jgi:Fe-S oxidoreductase
MRPGAGRGQWAEGLGLKDLAKESAPVAFFSGCRCSFDEELRQVARTAAGLLGNAGIDIGIMGDAEICCGSRPYSMGYRDDFNRLARANIKAWTRAGVKTVVTPCADCYWAFNRLYPREAGADFEVLHIVEYIDRLITQGKIKLTRSLPVSVTYHDPCHLGRLGEPYVPWNGTETRVFGMIKKHIPPKPRYNGARGVYEAPRNILKAITGLKLIEMERSREYSWCCGAGGGVKEAYPDFSNWAAAERIEEARSTGAEALVTACPGCERNFIDALSTDGQKFKVYDLMELVQQAI